MVRSCYCAGATKREHTLSGQFADFYGIIQIVTDPSIWVRRAVAGRTQLPESVAATLTSDPDPDPSVRQTLAENLRIPLPGELNLATDPDGGVRAAVEELQAPGASDGG